MTKETVGLGRDYIRKACEIFGLDPMETGSIVVHFDPKDFVWVEIKQFLSPEKCDRVFKLVQESKDGLEL